VWEHPGCLDNVQQDAISKCGHLECHGIGPCKMWAMVEGTITISTNATRCMTKFYYFCGAAKSMCHLKMTNVHKHIIQSGLEFHVFMGNNLVDMYAKCGNIEDVGGVFNRMPSRDMVTWIAMILGHVQCGQGQKTLNLFQQI